MIQAGLARLYRFQHDDGGWGWWRFDGTSREMTTYVMDGLLCCRQAGVEVRQDVLDRAVRRLAALRPEAAGVCALARAAGAGLAVDREELAARLRRLSAREARPAPATLARLAVAARRIGLEGEAQALLDRLGRRAVRVPAQGAVHWNTGTAWRGWAVDPVETAAVALDALLELRPASPLCPGIVRWLLAQRRGGRWHSTRATAVVLWSLARYLRRAPGARADQRVELRLAGRRLGEARFRAADPLAGAGPFVLRGSPLPRAGCRVQVVRHGGGDLVARAELVWQTREEDLRPAASGLAVTRSFHLIRRVDNAEHEERRIPLPSGATIRPGDVIEVELVVTSGEAGEYLALEDYRAAGLEPANPRSDPRGWGWFGVRKEVRDDRVVFFQQAIGRGAQHYAYRLVAEAPGETTPCPPWPT